MSDQSRSTDASREALSALVDGQARPDELSQILQAWKGDADTRAAWRDYQFVGDVMRSAELAQGTDSDRFLHNFRARLADEPVVLAPAAARAVEPRVAPAAMLNAQSEAIVAVGAIIADIPMVDELAIQFIQDGDWVVVDGDTVEVYDQPITA